MPFNAPKEANYFRSKEDFKVKEHLIAGFRYY
jgi:hypothetical protein